ncbi:MAG: hypothetical protein ABI281_03885 [Caldimonas sp.]
MLNPDDRRSPEHTSDDEFSPEYLAMLVVCGGKVRDSDWSVLPEALVTRHFAAPEHAPDDDALPPPTPRR